MNRFRDESPSFDLFRLTKFRGVSGYPTPIGVTALASEMMRPALARCR